MKESQVDIAGNLYSRKECQILYLMHKEMTYQEIANILGLKLVTIHKAKSRLEQRLGVAIYTGKLKYWFRDNNVYNNATFMFFVQPIISKLKKAEKVKKQPQFKDPLMELQHRYKEKDEQIARDNKTIFRM